MAMSPKTLPVPKPSTKKPGGPEPFPSEGLDREATPSKVIRRGHRGTATLGAQEVSRMSSIEPTATSSVEIGAGPESVYALITDLGVMSELAEETSVMRWQNGTAAAPGAVFKGTNRNGWRRWTTKCTVTDAEPGQRFAFDVSHTAVPISRWQYDIASSDAGCVVTESTWDRRPGWYKTPAGLVTGVMNRAGANSEHIQATLQRLKARAEASTR
jgi:hypothetical protein